MGAPAPRMRPRTRSARAATCSATSGTRRARRRAASSCTARATPQRAPGSPATCAYDSCAHSTECGRRSSWARTSCSSWACSRVDLAARAIEGASFDAGGTVVVERVRVVQVAVGAARLLEHGELELAEAIPRLRIFRLTVSRLAVEAERV